MAKIGVLITGLGAPVGVSILKALRQSTIKVRVVGVDADPLAAGLYRVDAAYLVPRADQDENTYLTVLKEICRKEKIEIIFPGSEAEMAVLARYKDQFLADTGSIIVVNDPVVIETAADKWLVAEMLRRHEIPSPAAILPGERSDLLDFIRSYGFPLIVKPRHGSGSKGVYKVKNLHELEFFTGYVPQPVVQEYLYPDNEEYTVGLFLEEEGKSPGAIVMKRVLAAGLSYKTMVMEEPDIESVCLEAARALGVLGPCNIQLRKTGKGPKIFEVNPRISSTAVIRAYYGYNEPEMAIRMYIFKEKIPSLSIKKGIALRYWDEIYLEKAEYLELKDKGYLCSSGAIRPLFF